MLLDFQMPRKNGLQVLDEVKEMFSERNSELFATGSTLVEPKFIFLTSYCSLQFQAHLKKKGVTEIYEKPLSQS
jgi:CheY-like chemotaxis protein